MPDEVLKYIETLEIENKSYEQNLTTITFYSDVRLSPVIYQNAPNWKQKLWAKSNDNNVLLGCPIESRNISKRSKLKTEALNKF